VWQNLPLNAKLIGSLTLVQATILAVGVLWVGRLSEATRLGEVRRRLDTQGDAVQSFVSRAGDRLILDTSSEAIRELSEDSGFFFMFQTPDGRTFAEAKGPSPEVRAELQTHFKRVNSDRFYSAELTSGTWILQSEPFRENEDGDQVIGYSLMAINAQPALDEVANFRRKMALYSLVILFAGSVGGGFVISFSTRNLRSFAHQIRTIAPPKFEGAIKLSPQSSEERLLFESYQEVLQAARASSESQRLFIAHASHELKTPIAAAMAALEVTLARPRASAEYEQTCRDVLGEVKTLRRLSTALLDFARMESLSDGSNEQTAWILEVIDKVKGRWEKIAGDRSISLTFSVPRDKGPLTIRGSNEQWEVVLGNLVENAIKYGRNGGNVEIRLENSMRNHVEIVIADDGQGMPSEQVSRLGEIFFRADAARSTGDSFGLGYAHAKRIVEYLGGTIQAASAPGEGTTVKINTKLFRAQVICECSEEKSPRPFGHQ
jgi:signal transduction histidine kinase